MSVIRFMTSAPIDGAYFSMLPRRELFCISFAMVIDTGPSFSQLCGGLLRDLNIHHDP